MAARAVARRCEQGLTLVELIITIVVLSIALVGILGVMTQMMRHGADTFVQIRAAELGQSYLDEILPKAYAGCGSTSRANFDGVDCYQGLDESPPRGADGGALEHYGGYRARVAVEGTSVQGRPAKRVTVTVSTPVGEDFVFAAYRLEL